MRGFDGDYGDDDASFDPDPHDDPDAVASRADWERKDRRENPDLYADPDGS